MKHSLKRLISCLKANLILKSYLISLKLERQGLDLTDVLANTKTLGVMRSSASYFRIKLNIFWIL